MIPLMLLMGAAFGALMGGIIHFRVQPFIVGWRACFCQRNGVLHQPGRHTITDPIYRSLSLARIHLIGKSVRSVHVIVAFVVLAVFMYLAHLTRFGRTVYAMGGNEQSAAPDGLNVGRTKVMVYTLGGFCSALAGLVFSNNLLSGHACTPTASEMEAIAAVDHRRHAANRRRRLWLRLRHHVFNGVLVNGLIQVLIIFNGEFSSWMARIVIGLLTRSPFILVQSNNHVLLAETTSRHPRQLPGKRSDAV